MIIIRAYWRDKYFCCCRLLYAKLSDEAVDPQMSASGYTYLLSVPRRTVIQSGEIRNLSLELTIQSPDEGEIFVDLMPDVASDLQLMRVSYGE